MTFSPEPTEEDNFVTNSISAATEDFSTSDTPNFTADTGNFTVVPPFELPAFPPSPLYIFVLKTLFCGLVLLITLTGNILVLVSFATTRKLQTYTNYYLVGLAVADLVSGGVTPALLNATFLVGYWPFGSVVCRAFIYVNTVFVHATFLLTFIICVDRYRATIMPLKHLQEKNKKHALKMILPGFLVPMLLWAVVILVLPEYGVFAPVPPYECRIPYASNKFFLLGSSLFISWIPIIGTSILYAFIYFKVIRKRNKERGPRNRAKQINTASLVKTCDLGTIPELPVKLRDVVNADRRCSVKEEIKAEEENVTESEASRDDVTGRHINRVNSEIIPDVKQATTTDCQARGEPYSSYHQKRLTSSRRATRTLAYIVAVMVISGTPWFFYSILTISTRIPRYPFVNWFVGYVVHLSSATNPFCYAICNPVFKQSFLRILCRCCHWKK
ncbi:muscarinic acetylcholine receptor M3-like [Acanthaster planci]|uniref:Muscarinic acetylcholine receptor M3-like n=1 Tax=Acanthaster planci TaxID=133434 RepID=A0A8B7YMD0_ACAPL|nr:muscarinic acetylcholine receptor M3-like [Acanthaster planci]